MNWTIKKRLYLLIGLSTVVVGTIGFLLYWSTDHALQGLNDLRNANDVQAAAGDLDMHHDAIRADVVSYIYLSGARKDEAAEDLKTDVAELQKNFDDIGKGILSPKTRELYSGVTKAIDAYKESALAVLSEDQRAADEQIDGFYKQFKFLEERLETLSKSIDEYAEATTTTDSQLLNRLFKAGVGFGLFAVAFIMAAGYLIARAVNNKIDSLIKELGAASTEVQQEASQINDASRSLAEASSRQAASLEETAASIEEVSSMVRQTADNSVQAKGLSQEVETASIDGVQTMQQMASAIDSIKLAAEETATIVKTIDEIAFQTNLLALNAAVEAARAGDAGKGFAVVAEEVRSLAQRSSVAAKDTSEKIRRSRELADNGVKATAQMRRSLELMKDKVTKTTCLINEIAAANQEQSVGLREVNKAASHLDQSTQQNAAQSEELSAASDQLLNQSKALEDVVKNLTVLVHGGNKPALSKVVAKPAAAKGQAAQAAKPAPEVKKDELQIYTLDEPVTPAMAKPRKATAVENAIELKPEQVIPLDDGDFQGF